MSKSTNTKPLSARVAAAEVLAHVLRGQSLSALLPKYASRVLEKERSLFKEICFGSLRWYPQIALLIKRLVEKPLREKDLEIQGLIACGIYQLMHMRTSEHAVVNETVAATKGLNRVWAKGLVNAVLRTFQREKASLLQEQLDNSVFQTAHPKWLLKKLEQAWSPDLAAEIVSGNNERGPMTLRVNTLRQTRDDYLERLKATDIIAERTQYSSVGITLEAAVDVLQLPGFEEGEISVQDEAAQLAASLLLLEPNQIVLDACCAP
ncbi:MAG: 16S rRNA (cytosine967-C5)-methyltransferase, partial [Porticoccaceae bacterium]